MWHFHTYCMSSLHIGQIVVSADFVQSLCPSKMFLMFFENKSQNGPPNPIYKPSWNWKTSLLIELGFASRFIWYLFYAQHAPPHGLCQRLEVLTFEMAWLRIVSGLQKGSPNSTQNSVDRAFTQVVLGGFFFLPTSFGSGDLPRDQWGQVYSYS